MNYLKNCYFSACKDLSRFQRKMATSFYRNRMKIGYGKTEYISTAIYKSHLIKNKQEEHDIINVKIDKALKHSSECIFQIN